MERLTERYVPNDEKKGIAGIKVFESEDKIPLVKVLSGEYLYPAIEKLADYEDLEEQGLLVRLPANKEIYIISSRWTVCSECGSRFDEYSCSGCEYECDSKKEYYVRPIYLSSINVSTYINQFGKTIFFTSEEAEKKLEEMKNE